MKKTYSQYVQEANKTLDEAALKGEITADGIFSSAYFLGGPIGSFIAGSTGLLSPFILGPLIAVGLYAGYKKLVRKFQQIRYNCKDAKNPNECLKKARMKEARENLKYLKLIENHGSPKDQKKVKKEIDRLNKLIKQIRTTPASLNYWDMYQQQQNTKKR
jgi:hypothetical protein